MINLPQVPWAKCRTPGLNTMGLVSLNGVIRQSGGGPLNINPTARVALDCVAINQCVRALVDTHAASSIVRNNVWTGIS